LSNNN